MKKKLRMGIYLAFITIFLQACNVPFLGIGEKQTEKTPTPNLTMTALFAPPDEITQPEVESPIINTATLMSVESTQAATSSPVPVESPTSLPAATQEPTVTQQPIVIYIPAATATPQVMAVTPIISGPCMRSAEVFDVMPVSTITVDGNFDDWYSNQYNVWNVVYGSDKWIGLSDTGATYRIAWTPWYLYVGVRVYDERYVQNAETGQDIYLGDSIEILFDADLCGDYSTASLNRDDFQIGISPGRGGITGDKEVYKWFPRPAGSISSMIDVASVSQDDGYQIEAAIPWTIFGIVPIPGYTYGFALSVSDNDDESENLQESMVSCVATRKLTNPTTWGTIILR